MSNLWLFINKTAYTKWILFSSFKRKLCELQVLNVRNVNTESPPVIDYKFLLDNANYFKELISRRKGIGDIDKVVNLYSQLHSGLKDENHKILQEQLQEEALKIPNIASPHLWQYGEEPKIVEFIHEKPNFSFIPQELYQLGKDLSVVRTDLLGEFVGQRGYYFRGALAEMEQALVKYTLSRLIPQFTLMSVPDLLYAKVIQDCGMATSGKRSQVYHLSDTTNDVCLAGTAEMSIGGYLKDRIFTTAELPLRLVAVSRCFRSEMSGIGEEKRLYRLHNFTKVEMFGVTSSHIGNESDQLYREFIQTQKSLFSGLDIHFRVLDMPLHELGAPAYMKTDIEAWMPGREIYGEISSTSNCTDYQSRRLNIRYRDDSGELRLGARIYCKYIFFHHEHKHLIR